MNDLSQKDLDIIQNSLDAFNANFEPIVIKKFGKTYFTFRESDMTHENWHNEWVDSTCSIYHIEGWLQGCVKALYKIVSPL